MIDARILPVESADLMIVSLELQPFFLELHSITMRTVFSYICGLKLERLFVDAKCRVCWLCRILARKTSLCAQKTQTQRHLF